MLRIGTNGVICLTRGDSARFAVDIINDITKEAYTVEPTDTLKFTVKKAITDTTPKLQIITVGENEFYLRPADTAGLDFGKYIYDVEVVTAGGDVYTVIEHTVFELTKEVHSA